ncbi:hypothetical protein WJX72_000024 [[Myrmecia] bisecta]|uniref:Uncharacterized protein n=1 Tax=[Myrmecia] bisecta TaxID=41462 RepID=A0AAW1QDX2_9CHLO
MADNFRKLCKTRLLDEMLGEVRDQGGAEWSVLVMDATTTRVMSSSCRISEILDYGVSLVENITKRREPLPALAGIYFITPTESSITCLLEDFKLRPLYKTAHVFFSSKVSNAALSAIKACPGLTSRLKSLKEVNLELLTIDKRTFITGEEQALQVLFGENVDNSAAYRTEVATIANRLVTAFASLKEFPAIRFRASKPPGEEAMEQRSLVAQRIAVEVNERLMIMQRAGQLPAAETCDLIVIDRGFDPVAPVIHEWTYEAMAYDLLNLEGNTFKYESETQGGKIEQKEHVLGESDDLWVDLRHKHFAAASLEISKMLEDFRAKNKVASYKNASDGGGAASLDTRDMRRLAQSLPQYREQLAKLSVHVEIASKINKLLDEKNLTDLGKLEQDLVFGDATSKEVITYLSSSGQALSAEDKTRLLMCYVATHPEKMDSTKQLQWQKLAKLQAEDMNTIINLEFLGVPVRKRGKTTGLSFGRKRKRAVRKDRDADEDEAQWALSRFVPMLQEVLEDLAVSKLSNDEYPYVRPPTATDPAAPAYSATYGSKAGSVRTNRTTAGWAKKAAGGAGAKEEAVVPKGKRVVVYVIGGVTRSEMRVAHKLSAKLGREIILGGSTVDTPAGFLKHLKGLSSLEQVAIDMDSFSIEK